MKKILQVIGLTFISFVGIAQIPAFPGAEGGGMHVTGGRGGRVLFVDNLNDKGDGSLRKAIEAEGTRIIVFRVSGNIKLNKMIHIKNGDLTIAGQTSPGDGICLENFGIRIDAGNLIIRYIRIRPGDTSQEENDAIYSIGNKNIIIDHCSFSWASDEVASFYDNENFTLQWCIISESFYQSDHHKGEHGYGGIWGGWNASFHHNLLSDHTSRNPRLCGSRYSGRSDLEKADIRNNVIYNWGFNTIYGGEEGHYNIVNNYFKPGPATQPGKRNRILELTRQFYNSNINPDTLGAGWFFIDGNVMEGNEKVSKNNWEYGVEGSDVDDAAKSKSKLQTPVRCTPVRTTDAHTAFKQVIKHAGASLHRDAVDLRIVDELKTGREQYGKSYEKGSNGIIDSQKDVGGWPVLKQNVYPVDSDNDGMPDDWEKQNNLNPFDDSDHVKYSLSKDYSNIEIYINSLVPHF
jgi:hypothetical protein